MLYPINTVMKLKQLLTNENAVILAVIVIVIVAIYFKTRNNSGMKDLKIRGCDPQGCGDFHASRGTREHGGVDLVVTEGQLIKSPISGKITRYPFPYANDKSLTGIEIVNDQYKVKVFYISPTAKIGDTVRAGDKLGTAQNVAAKYGGGMTNHIHVEFSQNGQRIDPTNLLT